MVLKELVKEFIGCAVFIKHKDRITQELGERECFIFQVTECIARDKKHP